MLKKDKRAFTIVELMIASSVFSVMLLVVLGSVMYLGRLYYKGVTVANTLEVNRSVIDAVSNSIRLSSEPYSHLGPSGEWAGAYCAGGKKYSYKLGVQLVVGRALGSGQSNRVLVVSNDHVCNTVEPLYGDGSATRELLKDNMRLTGFSLVAAGGDLTSIDVGVAFGGDPSDATVDPSVFNIESGRIVSCRNTTRGSSFCAVSLLSTSALRRVD